LSGARLPVRGVVRVDLAPAADAGGAGWTGVAIDVLRATTTLARALEHGAAAVLPCATVGEARAARAARPAALLCGERDGRRVEGFDLGNSPAEYDAATVAGRTLVFASTNGSLALRAIAGCRVRMIAAFVNATATADALAAHPRVRLVCAGKVGRFALEDAALAGWLARALAGRGARLEGGAARLAERLAPRDAAGVRALVQGSEHGRYLRSLGPAYAADLEECAALDVLDRAFVLA
jgi:phosphosulfolactate phosphohydrolase-like enzyme